MDVECKLPNLNHFFFRLLFILFFPETDWKVARIHQLAFDTATEETKPYVSREISGLAGACYRQAGPILGERGWGRVATGGLSCPTFYGVKDAYVF